MFPSIQRSVDPLVLSLLQNSSHRSSVINHSEVIKTATFRIPEFSAEHLANNIQDPNFGYSLLSPDGHPGDCPFLQDRHIFSIGSILESNTFVQHFSSIWGPSGLQLDFHFLVMFIIEPVAIPSHLSTSPSPSDLRNTAIAAAQSQQSYAFQWPAQVSQFSASPSVTPEMQHYASQWPAQVPQFGASPSVAPEIQREPSGPPLDVSGVPGVASPQPVQFIDYIGPIDSLATAEEQLSAIFFPSQKSFFFMARNWFCMWNILRKCDLNSVGKNEDRKHREAAILQHFKWAATTYRNKTQLFEWALNVSNLNWQGGNVRSLDPHLPMVSSTFRTDRRFCRGETVLATLERHSVFVQGWRCN